MADPKPITLYEHLKSQAIRPETPALEAFLGVGYGGLTVKKAEAILEAAVENPSAFLLSKEAEQAKAFLAAYHAAPSVVATRAAWVPPILAE